MSRDFPPEGLPLTSSGCFKCKGVPRIDGRAKSSAAGRGGPRALQTPHKNGQNYPGAPEPSRKSKKPGNFNIYGRSMSHPEGVSSRLERARAYGLSASERNRRKYTLQPSQSIRRVQSSGNQLYSEPISGTVEYRQQHPAASSKCTSYFDTEKAFQFQDWINSSMTISDLDPLDAFSPSSGQNPNLMSSTCISELISADSYHVDRGVQTTLESGPQHPINKSKLCPIKHWDRVSGEPIQESKRSGRHKSRSSSRFEFAQALGSFESKSGNDENELRSRVEGLKQSVAAMRQEARMLKLQTEEKVLLKEMAALTTYLSNTKKVLSCMDERYQNPLNAKSSVAGNHDHELQPSREPTSSVTSEFPFIRQGKCAAVGSMLSTDLDPNCPPERFNNVEKRISGSNAQSLSEHDKLGVVGGKSQAKRQEDDYIHCNSSSQSPESNQMGYVRAGSVSRRNEDWNPRLGRTLDTFAFPEEVDNFGHDGRLRPEKGKVILEARLQNAYIAEHVECADDRNGLEVAIMDVCPTSKMSGNCDAPEGDSRMEDVSAGEEAEDVGVFFQSGKQPSDSSCRSQGREELNCSDSAADCGYISLEGETLNLQTINEDARKCQDLAYASRIEEGQGALLDMSSEHETIDVAAIGQDPKESSAETDSVKSLDTARTWIVPEDILNSSEDAPEEVPAADGEEFSGPLESNRESVSSRELVTRTDADYISAFVEAIMSLFLRNIPGHMQDHTSPVPWKVFAELQSARKPNKDQKIFDKCIFEALNEVVRETYRMCNRVKGILENSDDALHCIPLPPKHKWITDAKEKILGSVHHRSMHYDAIGAVLSQDAWYLHNSMMDIESEINQLQSNIVV